ncbi:MAG: glycosyltransferase family 4 protein [Chloroflexi bacterium]|nr:glycosyltransferase family 4 protein [Chloroflexota bacterium]
MKIALVSPYDLSYPGGVTVHISNLKRYFTQWGHQVKIIAPCSSPMGDPSIIPVGRPVPVPSGGSMARITLSLTLNRRVRAILDAEKFDVVHVHEPLTPMLPYAALRLSGSLNVGTFHAYHQTARLYGLTKLILRRWSGRLHGRIAVSQPALEYVSKYFPGKYVIIPNGVDVEHFSPRSKACGPRANGSKTILFVGRLEKRKGLDYLLAAYQKVKQDHPNVRLEIVGPGTLLRPKYEKLVRDRQLADVSFAGLVPYDDLPRYYNGANVFCAPATGGESFGMVLLEAMAMGRPVVATAINGYSQLVSQGVDGLLVPPRDEAALARAISSLLDNPALCEKMAAQGRAKAEDYSWEKIARRVLEYYDQLQRQFGLDKHKKV